MLLENLRKEVLQASLDLLNYNLVTLTGGNVSGRDEETGYIAITPSGMDYRNLTPSDIVLIDIDGNTVDGKWKASVDSPDHLYIYKHRDDINSIIHTHSTYSSCFAILNESIECASTTLANEVGGSVPVAKFSPPTSNQMGKCVIDVIGDRRACLLANHGVIAVGPSVKHALTAAVMLEDAAKVYYLAKSIGTPVLLPDEEVQRARNVFLNVYGQDK
ncbi:class II aldolase/adducin family protein [Clostridioides sp. ES-S-0005-03]|uniref:class II aldolase/adducin family protein n=1 Tax=Clostridioides sp. ES-S-0005-03 TaxID=2770774 RepID=UPI001D10099C|nr:class II aldolase/adducin family protein [Clostridioides sp. ES-S-0005-03]UDN47621.1 class II aldolase/adducin family protein [Clostridioides sp. ES-S-0173-01]